MESESGLTFQFDEKIAINEYNLSLILYYKVHTKEKNIKKHKLLSFSIVQWNKKKRQQFCAKYLVKDIYYIIIELKVGTS